MPPKTKSEHEKQLIRTKILDAARSLFVERGVDAVTMREIARQVGYSPTALYLHFADKESLLGTLCATDFLALATELHQATNMEISTLNPVEELLQLGKMYVQFAITHPNHYQFMFMTPKLSTIKDKSTLQLGNPEQDAYAQLLLAVNQAYDKGCFREELTNPLLIAQTLWAGLHGLCALEITKKNDDWFNWQAFEQRAQLMHQTLLDGLVKPDWQLNTKAKLNA